MRRLILCAVVALLVVTGIGATEIHYLDLHQAGSSAIIFQDTANGRKVILVDAGQASTDAARGGARVLEQLRALGVTQIDLAIFSHIDNDHFGGYRNLLGITTARPQSGASDPKTARGPPRIKIRTVIEPGRAFDKPSYPPFLRALRKQNIEHVTPRQRSRVAALETRFHLKLFWPARATNTNTSSLLVCVDDPQTGSSQLLTGDTTARAWQQIAPTFPNQHVTAITAPHHGGDPVLLDLLDKTQPSYIVFQANAENQYRHPSLRVLRDLAAHNVDLDLRERERLRDLLHERNEMLGRFAEALIAPHSASFMVSRLPPITWAPWLQRQEEDFDARTSAMRERARTDRIWYFQLLLTSECGDITITDDKVAVERSRYAFMDEAIWYHVRYLTDDEITTLGTWREARAYLMLRVLDDLAMFKERLAAQQRAAQQRAVMVMSRQRTDARYHLHWEPGTPFQSNVARPDPSFSCCDEEDIVRILAARTPPPEEHLPAWTADYEAIVRRLLPDHRVPPRDKLSEYADYYAKHANGMREQIASDNPVASGLAARSTAAAVARTTVRQNAKEAAIRRALDSKCGCPVDLRTIPDYVRLAHEVPLNVATPNVVTRDDIRRLDREFVPPPGRVIDGQGRPIGLKDIERLIKEEHIDEKTKPPR